MAEEILVKETLSRDDIEAGEELLGRLDASEGDVIAAYWIFDPEVAHWRLEFVSPLVESKGPLWFYAKTYSLRKAADLDVESISVIGPKYTFYKDLVNAVNSRKPLSDIRLNRVMVGGQLVDLYIYRLPAKRSEW